MRVMDGQIDGRQEVAVLMVLVVLEAEVPGAGERPQALFTQVHNLSIWVGLVVIWFCFKLFENIIQ